VITLLLAACIGLQAIPDGKDSGSVSQTVGGITLDATRLDFGELDVGDIGEEALVLTNLSGKLVHVNATIAGEHYGVNSTGLDLEDETETVLTITYEPDATGEHEGVLSLEMGGEAATVDLFGSAVGEGGDTGSNSGSGAEISTDQPSLAFGKLDLYSASMKQLVVTNVGTDPLSISAATSSDTAFVLGGNLTPPRTLDPGEYRVVEVTFTPTAEKSYSANLTLTSDDPGAPTTRIALTGEGVDLCDVCSPLLEVDTGGSSAYAMTDFLSIYGSSDARTITVGNDGDEDLVVSDVEVKNDIIPSCGTFTLSGWTGSKTVAPGKTTSFKVTYKGDGTCVDLSFKELDNNVLHIYSNDPVEDDYVIELQGSSIG
jgi:hypothetical protein